MARICHPVHLLFADLKAILIHIFDCGLPRNDCRLYYINRYRLRRRAPCSNFEQHAIEYDSDCVETIGSGAVRRRKYAKWEVWGEGNHRSLGNHLMVWCRSRA